MPRVLIVRGQLVTPWELRPWAELPERYDVSYLLTRSNEFDVASLPLQAERVTALRDRMPRRLVWEKGHQDVLRAVALLARDGVQVRMRIVGRGPEEGRLRAYAAELGI